MFTVTEEERMKAIVFEKTGGPEVLALADVPKPDVRGSRWAS
jgi:NADPH:quinone reductase-like Zn-dependent oxidoreductase